MLYHVSRHLNNGIEFNCKYHSSISDNCYFQFVQELSLMKSVRFGTVFVNDRMSFIIIVPGWHL